MRRRPRLLTAAVAGPVLALGLLSAPAAGAAPAGAVVTVAPAWPPGSVGTATINATTFHRGDTVTVDVRNTEPGRLTLTIASPDKRLDTDRVDRTYVFTVTVLRG